MEPYNRDSQHFAAVGIDLSSPPDSLREGHFRLLENVRGRADASLESRPGLVQVGAAPGGTGEVHSARRLNSELSGTWTRFIGVGTKLFTGQTGGLIERGSGYSGDPLSLVPYRPDQSVEPWMYVGDRLKMKKYHLDGTEHNVGLPSPPAAPLIDPYNFITPFRVGANQKIINDCGTIGDWAHAGTAGGAATSTRINTTIQNITSLLGGSLPRLCWVRPLNPDNIGPGMRIRFNSGGGTDEIQTVQQVFKGSALTTIASIKRYAGTGWHWVTLANPLEIEEGAMVMVDASNFYVVMGVAFTPDGQRALKMWSSVGIPGPGTTIQAVPSFTVNLTQTHIAGETLTATAMQTQVTVGTGTFTDTIALDLSDLGTGPSDENSYIHLSIYCDKPNKLKEARLMFDIDDGSFTKNYYFRAIRPSDITPAISGQQTMLDNSRFNEANRIRERRLYRFGLTEQEIASGYTGDYFFQPRLPDDPPVGPFVGSGGGDEATGGTGRRRPAAPGGGASTQARSGINQYSELWIKRSDFTKIGSADHKSWNDIVAVRMQFDVTDTVIFRIDALWMGGTSGPDVGELGAPYYYRYRFRCSSTGVASNWSPPSREGLSPRRQAVKMLAQSYPPFLGASEADVMDWQRWGGNLLEWTYLTTTPVNDSGLLDTFSDEDLLTNPQEGQTNFQPFPVVDSPKSGTCNVAGCIVSYVSGNPFDIRWAPGTSIQISGRYYTILRVHDDEVHGLDIELVESAGSGTGLSWRVPEPVLLGQPLPVIVEWDGRMWGLGDFRNPGMLYFTNKNNPDGTSESYKLELTTSSDPLQNAVVYNSRLFVFSSEKAVEILPDGRGGYQHIDIPVGRGLFSRWALAVGPRIWFLSKDGIYETDGGWSIAIDTPIRTLLPQEGVAGSGVEGVLGGVDMRPETATKLRLCYDDNYLYFCYPEQQTDERRVLTYIARAEKPGWWADKYAPGAVFMHGEEGSGVNTTLVGTVNSVVCEIGGTSDNGNPIPSRVITQSRDQGNQRSEKLYGDLTVDLAPGGLTVSAQPLLNNAQQTLAATAITGSARRQSYIDLDSGRGVEARNIGLALSWSGATGLTRLYRWESSYHMRPEDSVLRATEYADEGFAGPKYVRGFILEADTDGQNRTFRLEYDGGQLIQTFSANHNGRTKKVYSIATPVPAYLVRIRPTDQSSWKIYSVQYIKDDYPDLSTVITPWTDGGNAQAKFVQGMRLTADTSGAMTIFEIQFDGEQVGAMVASAHSGKVTVAHSFDPVFIAHEVRVRPLGPARIFAAEFIWEPLPELADYYETQGTTHDITGFQHVGKVLLALISNEQVSLVLNVDGVDKPSIVIPSTGGVYKKVSVEVPAYKGRLWAYKLRASGPAIDAVGFRLFQRDCEVWVKGFNSAGPYEVKNPFGDVHRVSGARI
jgi:hypothetical protein